MALVKIVLVALLAFTWSARASDWKQEIDEFALLTSKQQLYDESTLSNLNDIWTEHYDLQVELDFEKKVFHGELLKS